MYQKVSFVGSQEGELFYGDHLFKSDKELTIDEIETKLMAIYEMEDISKGTTKIIPLTKQQLIEEVIKDATDPYDADYNKRIKLQANEIEELLLEEFDEKAVAYFKALRAL